MADNIILPAECAAEMRRVKSYFPYRVISGVVLPDGKWEVFANTTAAKANNFARKHGGAVFRFGREI